MDATLQDLIDRGVERIYVELASPFVEEGVAYNNGTLDYLKN